MILIQPNIPHGLNPSASQAFNAIESKRFTWIYTNPIPTDLQSAYYIEYKENVPGSSTTTIETASSNAYHNFLADVFTNGHTYVWRLKLKDTTDQLYSDFSDWVIFKCSSAPTVLITNPAVDDQTIQTDIPTFEHSYSDSGGLIQKNYQYQVYRDDEITLVWQSDVLIGTETSIVMPSSYLNDVTYYKVCAIVQNSDSISTTSSFRRFYTNWETPTITPDFQVEGDSTNARFNITWSDIASIPGYLTGIESYGSAKFSNGLILSGISGEKLYWIKYIPSIFTLTGWYRHLGTDKTILFLYKDSNNFIRFGFDNTENRYFLESCVDGNIRTIASTTTPEPTINQKVFYAIVQNATGIVVYTKVHASSLEVWGDIE